MMNHDDEKDKPSGEQKERKPDQPDTPSPPDGDKLKEDGIRRATDHNPAAVLALQIGLLGAILEHGAATVDTGENRALLCAPFGHRGLRGAAVSGLRATNVIRTTGRRLKSQRPHRHSGENRGWEATDPTELPALISRMECRLADLLGDKGGAA